MKFLPKNLASPDPRLALIRLTDFTDRGMARYRLSEVEDDSDESEPLLEFYGASDGEVEAFLIAWHRGDVFRVTPGRYIWYMQARERVGEYEHKWQSFGLNPDDDELAQALTDYRDATCFTRLLLNAFSGIWLDLTEGKSLP